MLKRAGTALLALAPFLFPPAVSTGEDLDRVRAQALEVEILNRVRRADASAAAGNYEDALARLRDAELVRLRLGGEDPALSGRRARWELARQQALDAAGRDRLEGAEADLLRELQGDKRRLALRRAELEARFREALEGRRYAEAERHLQGIRDLDPDDPELKRLRELLSGARLEHARLSNQGGLDEEWRNLREMSREQAIPYSDTPLRYPARWNTLVRGRQAVLEDSQVREEAWRKDLAQKLRQRVQVRFEGAPFDETLSVLAARGGISINLDASARGVDVPPVTFRSDEEGMTLETALNWALKGTALTWTLRDEAVLVGSPEGLTEPSVLARHDVRDILVDPVDHVAPKLQLAGANSAGVELETPEESEEEPLGGEDLIEFVKQYVFPQAWGEPQNAISYRNGLLFVNAPERIQEAIRKTLAGFRKQRVLQVLVQARFITITQIEYETLAFDWSSLNVGILSGTPPVGAVNPSLVPLNQGFWNSGILHTQAQIFNGFNYPQGSGGIFPRPFNGVPNVGDSLVAQIAYLDDFQLQAILYATEKSSRANLLTAPSALCFNTQRANLVDFTQRAYIQDYTAVVQVQAVGYDPEIGYVMTGVVFDVRPIVSADRKYITLEMLPTVAQLNTLRSVPAGANNGAFLFVEAPIVQLQSTRTTVSVPDGGTVMLAGMTEYDQTSNYASVPFLSKIPFLSALFRDRSDAENRRQLVVIVTAKIIDQKEEEEARFGK